MCLRSRDVPKMDPGDADMALAVWNGCARDARRHAHQWTCTSTFSMIAMVWVSWLVPEAGRFYVSRLRDL